MEIRNIPEYHGAGVYALVDEKGNMYIGSSKDCRSRILSHKRGDGGNFKIREYVSSGGFFTAEILEQLPEASDKELEEAERQHIQKAGELALYNIVQAVRGAANPNPQPKPTISIADVAKQKGISTQAIYKRLAKLGIQTESLRDPLTGGLSPTGLATLETALLHAGQTQRTRGEREAGQQPTTNNRQSTVNHQSAKVDKLQKMVDELQHQVAEQRHRAELAELKAEAVADERDFLRRQLDNAIKANALASVKRLTAPEPDEPAEAPAEEAEAVPVEDQPQQPERQRIGARIRAAWQIIRGK